MLKGMKHSMEAKQKMSEAKKGNKYCLNRKLSEKTKRKIGKAIKGNRFWLGRKHSLETRKKISKAKKGKNSALWKGGISSKEMRIRRGLRGRLWREKVFGRDNRTCQHCNSKEDLVAHHIKNFDDYPKLRLVVSNGLTLCRSCHGKIRKRKGVA